MSDDATPDNAVAEPVDAVASVPFDATPADVDVRTRVVGCPACGITFAVPAAWYVERAKADEPLHCPNGHASPAADGFDDAHARTIGLLVELATAKGELRRARRKLSMLSSGVDAAAAAKPVDDREIDRRVKLLATGLKAVAYRVQQCHLCGATFSVGHARNHLKKKHLAEIKAMPASTFA